MEKVMTDLSQLADFIVSEKLIYQGFLAVDKEQLALSLARRVKELLGEHIEASGVQVSMEEDQYVEVLGQCQQELPALYSELRGENVLASLTWPATSLICQRVAKTGGLDADERLVEIAKLTLFFTVSAETYLEEARTRLFALEQMPQNTVTHDYTGGRDDIFEDTTAALEAHSLRKNIGKVQAIVDEHMSGGLYMERRAG
jgi:hypothetical protein